MIARQLYWSLIEVIADAGEHAPVPNELIIKFFAHIPDVTSQAYKQSYTCDDALVARHSDAGWEVPQAQQFPLNWAGLGLQLPQRQASVACGHPAEHGSWERKGVINLTQ